MAATFLTLARRKAAQDNRVEFFTSQAERQALYTEEYVEPDKCFRQTEVKEFYDSHTVQIGVAFLIFLNFIVEAVAAQILPEEDSKEEFVFFMLEIFFNTSFTIELIINLYGSWFFKFWKSGWNWFDFIIVGISIISMVFPQLPGITVLRLFRAFRVFRLFKRIPSLRKIIEGVLEAIPGVTQAFIIMFILMGIWSVIGVEFFRDATPEYFGDFIKAMFTMFQVMTMDFSSIARTLMYDHDYPFASIFFITFIFICGIVMTNVVVAILLDRYLASMDDNDAEDAMAKTKNFPTMYLEVDNSFKALRKVSWDDWEKISKLLNEFPTVYLEERMEYGSRNVMPVIEWSVDDVSWWLNKIGFGRYVSTFGEDMISGKWLLKIREADLLMYKMNLGERKTFLNELHKLIMEQEERMDQIASLRKMFDRYDDNGNGLIDQDEFMKVWEDEFDTEHRIPEEAIMETLRSLDTNGDMVIDFGEFVEATNKLKEKVKNQQKEKEKTVDEEIEYTEELNENIRKNPVSPNLDILEEKLLRNRSDSSPKKPWVGIIVYDERQFYAKIFPRENSDLVDASIIESKQSLGAGFVGKRVSGINSKDVLPLPDRSVMERDPSLSSSFGERNPRSSSGWVENRFSVSIQLTPKIDKREPEVGGKFSNTGGKDRQGEDSQAEVGGAETKDEEPRRQPEA